MTTTPAVTVTAEQRRQFDEEGYFILERVIPQEHLELLRDSVTKQIARVDAKMEAEGRNVGGITHKGKRYFIGNPYDNDPRTRAMIFADYMADICRATIGDEAYLFCNQYVVKASEVGTPFSWHQDSGYIGYEHTPYLTLWCALDDVSVENGTIFVLPWSRSGKTELHEHTVEEGTNDKVGYHGDDPGIAVEIPAGSIAVFSSRTFHRSTANTTPKPRRAFVVQYSPDIIMKQDHSGPWGQDIPFIKKGDIVADV